MDKKKFVMSYSGGKDCMLAMYRKIKEGCTPVALITTIKKDSCDSWTHSLNKKLLDKASESLNIPILKSKLPKVLTNLIIGDFKNQG